MKRQDIGHQEKKYSDLWDSGNQNESYDYTSLLLGDNSQEGEN